MMTSKPKNGTKPFNEKLKERLRSWSPTQKKRFAFSVIGLITLLAFTQFAVGIRNTYRMFNGEQHFLAADSAEQAQDIFKMLIAADSAEQAKKQHVDSLLEQGLIQTILSE